MDILLELAHRLRGRQDIGFLFVGRGTAAHCLREGAKARNLDNIVFYDEIDPSEIPGLYAQCHVGLIALDPRHKTHNIPGKFLSYMQAGLPVLASINPGNDLVQLIEREGIGRVCTDHAVGTLEDLAKSLVETAVNDPEVATRCRALSAKLFSAKVAVEQITTALAGVPERVTFAPSEEIELQTEEA
jgi:glycosyltransferase involved in cell wall biosynthesis